MLTLRLGCTYEARDGSRWLITRRDELDPPYSYPSHVFLGRCGVRSAWFMPDGAWSAADPTAIDLLREVFP